MINSRFFSQHEEAFYFLISFLDLKYSCMYTFREKSLCGAIRFARSAVNRKVDVSNPSRDVVTFIGKLKARLHDSVLGTARLNLGTRTYEFWHGTLNFCRVNRYKTGPRA